MIQPTKQICDWKKLMSTYVSFTRELLMLPSRVKTLMMLS
jgi:hypothetical protein